MKKIWLIILIMAIYGGSVIAQTQQSADRGGCREYKILIDLKPRILIIESEGDYLYMRYFDNCAYERQMQYLGEEIFRQGIKIIDTYKENDD